MRSILLATAILLTCTPLLAQHQKKPSALIGSGTHNCSEFSEKYKRDPEAALRQYFGWAQGFMSGFNSALLDPRDKKGFPAKDLMGIDLKDQMLSIRQYCDKNPQKFVLEAVLAVYVKLPDIPRE